MLPAPYDAHAATLYCRPFRYAAIRCHDCRHAAIRYALIAV